VSRNEEILLAYQEGRIQNVFVYTNLGLAKSEHEFSCKADTGDIIYCVDCIFSNKINDKELDHDNLICNEANFIDWLEENHKLPHLFL